MCVDTIKELLSHLPVLCGGGVGGFIRGAREGERKDIDPLLSPLRCHGVRDSLVSKTPDLPTVR